MNYFKKVPNIHIPAITDYDSFMYTYKIQIRRAVASFIDNPHYHDHIAIWYNASGSYDMYFNGENIHCTPGTLLCMPPFAVHAMDTRNVNLEETQIISISMPRDALYNRKNPVYPLSYNCVAFGSCDIPLCIRFSGSDKEIADNIFDSALSEYQKKSNMHRTRIFSCIDELIQLCQKHSRKILSPTTLTAARKRSDKIASVARTAVLNYTSPPSICEASKKAQITSRGFTKLFKNITNHTYHDFTTAVRAMEAIKLLRFTTQSIAEIAHECGYSDTSHFSKTFAKLFNSSPQLLRREMIEVARLKALDGHTSKDIHAWESTLDSSIRREHYLTALGKI